MSSIPFAREIEINKSFLYDFSICTLVTKKDEYSEMLESFVSAGFDTESCEYLFIDNCETNKVDAYKGINILIQEAQGKYIIICHQDILLNFDKRKKLEDCIAEIDKLDSNWGILSNTAVFNMLHMSLNVTYPDGNYDKKGKFPLLAKSVDEHFILTKKSANISLSNDLQGYHMYGTDMCLLADIRGYSAYGIDFSLTHKSRGIIDASFHKSKNALRKKYSKAFRSKYVSTTITSFYISNNIFKSWFFNQKRIKKLSKSIMKKINFLNKTLCTF